MSTIRTSVAVAVAATMLATGALLSGQADAQPSDAARSCPLPSGTAQPERATPDEVRLDPRAVQQAIGYASRHQRLSVQIFRHNCLVATTALNPVTGNVPYNVFSSTKSVVSMLTGIAWGQHRLELDDPIGGYLPEGWVDRAHRAITIRQLLTESAGLKESILSETATVGNDPNVARQALALPITHRPGTNFDYSQRTPDLLAYIVSRSIGEDLQKFAQRELFDPIGIPRRSYFWLRDRAGNSYGYAHLFIRPEQFAHLGLLMGNHGKWNGRQVIPAEYVELVSRPTAPNPCYGLLFWTNAGDRCKSANLPAAQVVDHALIPSAPRDLYAMVGALQQNNFMIPSLGIVVTWTGAFGDRSLEPLALVSAKPAGDLYYTFFRILMRGVQDNHIPDPGPYRPDPVTLNADPNNYLDPFVLAGGAGFGPYAPKNCTVVACPDSSRTAGPEHEIPDITHAAGASASPTG